MNSLSAVPKGKKRAASKLSLNVFTLLLICFKASSVRVDIDYSFYVPERFGEATVESANCCPYGVLPNNNTEGRIAPSFYGIGTQKGGTTSLYSYLVEHPLIVGDGKEMHYLDNFNLTKDSFRKYLSRWSWNREQIEVKEGPDGKIKIVRAPPKGGQLFEISPSYMLIPFAACRAKHLTPNAKFIVLLREPADRTYSGFNHVLHYNRNLPPEEHPKWAKKSFLRIVHEGIDLIDGDPNCDLRSGHGTKTFNDCFKCVMMLGPRRPECDHQTFVRATNGQGAFACSPMSKETVLRGLYGAQLAWWFTLLPPNQFKIISSDDFAKKTKDKLAEIMDFLGFDQKYMEEMTVGSKRANGGIYNNTFALQNAQAKNVLREFFMRPNLELYRLLHDTGHTDFTPFEPYLQKLDYVDCKDSINIKTGLCGTTKESTEQSVNSSISLNIAQASNPVVVQSAGSLSKRKTLSALELSEYAIHIIFSVILVCSSLYGLQLVRSLRK